jgi:hypothetical protein
MELEIEVPLTQAIQIRAKTTVNSATPRIVTCSAR